MANPLYQSMQQSQQNNGIFGMLEKIKQLKASGMDPNQQIQQLLNSGQVSQEQYNQAVAKAQQLRKIFNM